MTAELAPLPRKTTSPRLRIASAEAVKARIAHGVPVLEFKCRPVDMGRRAKHFEERADNDLLGQYKRAAYEVDGVLVYLQLFRYTDDGSMTLYVDLAACASRALSPLSLAARALDALGLADVAPTFVHTKAEELFWQRVDPLLVARRL